jgi:hypothetical protein
LFIQLIIEIPVIFISKQKREEEDKIAERPRENEGERLSVG